MAVCKVSRGNLEMMMAAPQRSTEWHRARIGIPTASNFDKIITPAGAPSKSAQSYMFRLVAERIFERSLQDRVDNKWTRHGIFYEDEAAREFEAISNERVSLCGFIPSADKKWGCSPDRLICGKNAAVEIKCPAPWTHIEYTLYGPGTDYKQQVQGQMLIGGYDKVYFYSYFPGMQSKFWPYERDEKFIKVLRQALITFSENLEKCYNDLIKMGKIDFETALTVISNLMPEDEE